jgi:hypothetical protein
MVDRIEGRSDVLVYLALIGLLLVMGCKPQPAKLTTEDYIVRFQRFIDDNSISNLVVATCTRTDWGCIADKHIMALSYYRILYSFDAELHTGDLIVRWCHTEEDVHNLWKSFQHSGFQDQARSEILFLSFYDSDIVCRKSEVLIPDSGNPCSQSIYYMRDAALPFPLEYILNDPKGNSAEIEFAKAMDAYFILQSKFRAK